MIKILVVEDERIERETLLSILGNNISNSTIYEARNGNEALQLFDEVRPDIVCADINMPGINGLDMIREMKKDSPMTKFLIVSSYNYFEYAQQAIRLGVADFILKPYNITEFLLAIQAVIDKLASNKIEKPNMIEEKIKNITPHHHDCLYAIISDEAEIELYRKIHSIDPLIVSGMCVLYRGFQEEDFLNRLHMIFLENQYYIIHARIHGFLTCFVMGKKTLSKADIDEIVRGLDKHLKNGSGVGVGIVVNDISKFHQSFLHARDHIGKHLPYQQQLYKVNNNDNCMKKIQEQVEDTISCFERMDEISLKNQMKKISNELLVKKEADLLFDLDFYYEQLLSSIKQRYEDIDLSDFMLLSLRISTNVYQELDINLNLNLKKLYHKVSDVRFKNTNHLVKEALQFIEQNYKKPIALNDLSERLKVSPYYISKLLSTTMHKTFTEMVAIKRVDVSKELLKGDVKIKEIASRVGFQGQSYYNKIFKKYTGMTPKVYRNKMKG